MVSTFFLKNYQMPSVPTPVHSSNNTANSSRIAELEQYIAELQRASDQHAARALRCVHLLISVVDCSLDSLHADLKNKPQSSN